MKQYLGIIGDPIEHTLSPILHEAALKAQKLDYTYLPFRVSSGELGEAIRGLKALGFVGVNVTIPHKVAVIPHLARLSKEAELIGAVNTLHLEEGQWVGYNTDGPGFLRSLQEEGRMEPKGARVLILGAGGAARAVAAQLGLAQASEIVIANRNLRNAEILRDQMQAKLPEVMYRAVDFGNHSLASAMANVEVIVNTTPVGMEGYPEQVLPIITDWIQPRHVVMDLVYRPGKTTFLTMAEQMGARTVSGLGMLLYQGAEAYQIWTRVEPPIEIMRNALLSAIK